MGQDLSGEVPAEKFEAFASEALVTSTRRDLQRNGGELLDIKPMFVFWRGLFATNGAASGSTYFRVYAKSVFGQPISRIYAFDPFGGGGGRRPGLKRHGRAGWADAD